jgi:hypothetical protein
MLRLSWKVPRTCAWTAARCLSSPVPTCVSESPVYILPGQMVGEVTRRCGPAPRAVRTGSSGSADAGATALGAWSRQTTSLTATRDPGSLTSPDNLPACVGATAMGPPRPAL